MGKMHGGQKDRALFLCEERLSSNFSYGQSYLLFEAAGFLLMTEDGQAAVHERKVTPACTVAGNSMLLMAGGHG